MDAPALIRALARVGNAVVRQSGSHIRLQHNHPKQHALTVPNHSPLKIGTLSAILGEVALQLGIPKATLIERILS